MRLLLAGECDAVMHCYLDGLRKPTVVFFLHYKVSIDFGYTIMKNLCFLLNIFSLKLFSLFVYHLKKTSNSQEQTDKVG
jgi:hypothetical protein